MKPTCLESMVILVEVSKAERGAAVDEEADLESAISGHYDVTAILIYRIFDNLINVFPGLSQMNRKGIEKEHVMNVLPKARLEDLRNPDLEFQSLVRSYMAGRTGTQVDFATVRRKSRDGPASRGLDSDRSKIDLNSSFKTVGTNITVFNPHPPPKRQVSIAGCLKYFVI